MKDRRRYRHSGGGLTARARRDPNSTNSQSQPNNVQPREDSMSSPTSTIPSRISLIASLARLEKEQLDAPEAFATGGEERGHRPHV
jgi:hypothetical protein